MRQDVAGSASKEHAIGQRPSFRGVILGAWGPTSIHQSGCLPRCDTDTEASGFERLDRIEQGVETSTSPLGAHSVEQISSVGRGGQRSLNRAFALLPLFAFSSSGRMQARMLLVDAREAFYATELRKRSVCFLKVRRRRPEVVIAGNPCFANLQVREPHVFNIFELLEKFQARLKDSDGFFGLTLRQRQISEVA